MELLKASSFRRVLLSLFSSEIAMVLRKRCKKLPRGAGERGISAIQQEKRDDFTLIWIIQRFPVSF